MAAKRLNKRQAREQQELEELSAAAGKGGQVDAVTASEDEGSANEEPTTQAKPASSIFAALGEGDGEGLGDDEELEASGGEDAAAEQSTGTSASKKKKNRKKKKKPAAAELAGDDPASASTAGASEAVAAEKRSQSQKKKTQKTSDGGNSKNLSNMTLDDFDSLLASQPHMAQQGGESGGRGARGVHHTVSPTNALRSVLSLSSNHLDPSIELKRQFGSAAIRSYEASNGGTSGGGPGASGARARMMARNPNLKLRSVLIQPREDWPPIARTFTGLNGEVVDSSSVDEQGGKVATWEHSKAYRAAQYEFQQAVATYDPNSIYALFRPYPWHVHLLSSLSDIAKHQGDLSQASDWNARILFAFERTASPVFVSSLTSPSGPMRVDFDRVENRGLFLAAHRMIAFLGRRGTWRTALEWNKLLLSLDTRDPHGSLLWIDFLAIKSRQHQWFVDDLLPKLKATRDIAWLGGLDFAEALGIRAKEREDGDKSHKGSSEMLKRGIARHPYLLPPLALKISLDLPSGFIDHPCVSTSSSSTFTSSAEDQQNECLREILAQLYSVRNESLWKDSDLKNWLGSCLNEAWSESKQGELWDPASLPRAPSGTAREGIYRHVIVADMPDALRQSLTSLLPRSLTSDSSNLDAYDPVPPKGPNVTRIDDEYFSAIFRMQGGRRSRSTVPGEAEMTGQGEGMLGRIAAFANQLGRFFQQGGGDAGEGRQGMPGGFGDDDDDDGEHANAGDAPTGDEAERMQRAMDAALETLPENQREEMQRLFAGMMVDDEGAARGEAQLQETEAGAEADSDSEAETRTT
ncbi:unnamed protein product [Jaminaea pallidilutea]